MDIESALSQAKELLIPYAVVATQPVPDRLDMVLQPDQLLAAVQALQVAKWGYLSAITGLDHPGYEQPGSRPVPVEEKKWTRLADPFVQSVGVFSTAQLEALYHFCQGGAILTLRVKVPRSNPVLPSICPAVPYAALYERELVEMLGFEIDGISQEPRFILPEDWPEGIYPLRKDFDGLENHTSGGGIS